MIYQQSSIWLPILAFLLVVGGAAISCKSQVQDEKSSITSARLESYTAEIILRANVFLKKSPETITSFHADRSAGGLHDYYSEGKYWWPNPEDPNGPYIRKDGESFPGLFTDHRDAIGTLSSAVSALTVAFAKTSDERYAQQAKRYLNAWFVDPATRMNPNLEFGQAIKGITQGRGIGIIDSRSLIYVARGIEILRQHNQLSEAEDEAISTWFDKYSQWLVDSSHGKEERDNGNNHSTWWGAQVAAFARIANRKDLLDTARAQYKRQLDLQMDERGVFTDEVGRTRPFHYFIYNLDAFAVLAILLSDQGEDIWTYTTSHGDIRKAADWYLSFKGRLGEWPYPSDLEPNLAYHPEEYLLLFAQRFPEDSAYAKTFIESAEEHQLKSPERMAVLTWTDQ